MGDACATLASPRSGPPFGRHPSFVPALTRGGVVDGFGGCVSALSAVVPSSSRARSGRPSACSSAAARAVARADPVGPVRRARVTAS